MGRAFRPAPFQSRDVEVIRGEIKCPMCNGAGMCNRDVILAGAVSSRRLCGNDSEKIRNARPCA